MAVPYFPRALLREKSHSWNLGGHAATPGATADSTAVVVRSDGGGYWIATMSDVSLGARAVGQGRQRQRNATLLWRAVRQVAKGGAAPMTVWCNDAQARPWPAGVAQGAPPAVPHGDDTPFSDGSEYEQAMIDIICGAAALRATSLGIIINRAGSLVGGERFSINHDTVGWRVYEISTVVYSDATHATIGFNPPLRENVVAGTALEFDRPRCTMRLATPGAMDLAEQPWTFNSVTVQFVEATAI
ncbi:MULTISPECIES: hypothetical protein [unclassified Bradyrhizobium]|uniref:hypothetical protein n=1 Tax=unclassified Bradyrhizobium TaxID=2631580 RepID=UPI002915D725|nr:MULTISPECIES: hypothetical protein [unclassified Bradyrhizobium]